MGDPRADGRIIIKIDVHKVGSVGMDGIELVQDRERWRELGNAVLKNVVP